MMAMAMMATVAGEAFAQEEPARPAREAEARRDPPGTYRGRQIADVMSWEGVDWLFRETRVEEEQPANYYQAGSSLGTAGGQLVGTDKIVGATLGSGVNASLNRIYLPARFAGRRTGFR